MPRRKTMIPPPRRSKKQRIVVTGLILALGLMSSGYFFYSFHLAQIPPSIINFIEVTPAPPPRPLLNASQCKPVTKIGFMKTHKTASSTVQSILFHFGLDRDLNFVLPDAGNHLNDPAKSHIMTEPFKVEWLHRQVSKIPWHADYMKKGMNYDIFNLHTIWNATAVRQLLGPEAKFITILRNPVDVFESLYAYANFDGTLKLDIHQYIQSLNMSESLYKHRVSQYMGLNQQLYDLGLSVNHLWNREAIEGKIAELESSFDLVMLADRFDESMVLLAQLLCWPLDHVKSLKLNARKAAFKVDLSTQERNALKQWQQGDTMLYQHFERIFNQKISEYGHDKMSTDVQSLKELIGKTHDQCVLAETDREHMDKSSAFRPYSHEVVAFKVKKDDHNCRLLGMAENQLVDLARNRQRSRWDHNRKNSKV